MLGIHKYYNKATIDDKHIYIWGGGGWICGCVNDFKFSHIVQFRNDKFEIKIDLIIRQ